MNTTWKQVKSIPEHMRNVSCRAIATEVRICPANAYCLFTNSLGKQKVYAKWILHVLNNDQRAMHVLLAATGL